MINIGSGVYSGNLSSTINKIGQTIQYRIYADDNNNPVNFRFSRNYTITGSSPIYDQIIVDGKNDFKPERLLATDPLGDSGDSQADLTEIYSTWDGEYLYFGLSIASSTNLMNWGGSNPTSIYMALHI